MELFLWVKRNKTTILMYAKEDTSIIELKQTLEGIIDFPVEDLRLYSFDNVQMEAGHLSDYGYSTATAKSYTPTLIVVAARVDGTFETPLAEDFASPPPLPLAMRDRD